MSSTHTPSRPRRLATAAVIASALILAASCERATTSRRTTDQGLVEGAAAPTEVRLMFAHAGHEFDGVIDRPTSRERNGWGVLLIGGGLGNDLDWTTPGSVTIEGREQRMTIDGRAHSDAPTLARTLCERGFTVMRWSTIARGDPLASAWPVRATPRTFAELTAQAQTALATLRSRGEIVPDRVILLGHSQGAARAVRIALDDGGVRGLALLSPAYVTPTVPVPKSIPAGEIRPLAEVLDERPIPTLAVFGALDTSRPVDAKAVAEMASARGDRLLEVRVLEGLGHQLGPVGGSLVGPMDAAVTAAVAEWAKARASTAR